MYVFMAHWDDEVLERVSSVSHFLLLLWVPSKSQWARAFLLALLVEEETPGLLGRSRKSITACLRNELVCQSISVLGIDGIWNKSITWSSSNQFRVLFTFCVFIWTSPPTLNVTMPTKVPCKREFYDFVFIFPSIEHNLWREKANLGGFLNFLLWN